ncbi:Uncharacterised protein r2_g1534 [Pycnogonum litorale]
MWLSSSSLAEMETKSVRPLAETSASDEPGGIESGAGHYDVSDEDADRPLPRKERSLLEPLVLESLRSPVVRRRQRRRKLIVDAEIRLTRDNLRFNLETSHAICKDRVEYADILFKSVKSLFNQPASGTRLADRLIDLYRRRFKTRSEEADDEDNVYKLLFPDEYSTTDSGESPIRGVQEPRVVEEREVVMPSREGSRMETPSLTAFQDQGVESDGQLSRFSARSTSKSMLLPIELTDQDRISVDQMEHAMEDFDNELMVEPPMEQPSSVHDEELYRDGPTEDLKSSSPLYGSQEWNHTRNDLMDKLRKYVVSGDDTSVTFEDLYPVESSVRKKVAVGFMLLLHFHKDKVIYVRQDSSFGQIFIKKSVRFHRMQAL